MAVEKIYLLVHPFWDVMQAVGERMRNIDPNFPGLPIIRISRREEKMKRKWLEVRLSKEEKYYLKMYSERWERLFRRVAANPANQIIIVEPFEAKYLQPQVRKRLEWMKRFLNTLLEKSPNKPLVIMKGFTYTSRQTTRLVNTLEKRVREQKPKGGAYPKVEVHAFGEYYNQCVSLEADNLSFCLRARNIETNVVEVKNLSIDSEKFTFAAESLKRVEQAWEKRTADRTEQKQREAQKRRTPRK